MRIFRLLSALLLSGIAFLLLSSCSRSSAKSYFNRPLKNHWVIFSADSVKASGRQISTAGFDTSKAYPATVPSTVMHVLVQNGMYKDVFKDMNLKKVPREPFRHPWWYRTEFSLNRLPQTLLLRFDGINYKADVWLNGKKIGDHAHLKNPFRQFTLNISKNVKEGKNVLAVKVYPPEDGDFTIGFVDWNPAPPDQNMGLFRGVSLEACTETGLSEPFVVSTLNKEFTTARLTASVVVTNYTGVEQFGKVFLTIDGKSFVKPVTLLPHETRKVLFEAEEFPELIFRKPKLWWPHTLGTPHLYHAVFSFHNAGKVDDSKEVSFGIRKVSEFYTPKGFRGFKINGKKILIRGGGWVDHLFLDNTRADYRNQLEYVKNMNLNAIRLEGFWGNSPYLYSLCDSLGIMVMTGWSCQWEWENLVKKKVDPKYGGILSPSDIALMSDAWHDQIVWLRNHPAIFVWLAGSDKIPSPAAEKRYLEILSKYDSTRLYLASAKEWTSTVGPSAVKMRGPYAYEPPVYWFADTAYGGAFGFNTETGPGAQIPPLQSIDKMLSPQHRWPVDSVWNYHCGRHMFGKLDRFTKALALRYGKSDSLADFIKKSQVMEYEIMRPMFEAFSARRYISTGVIQWMLNSAWPEMYWQLYDYYLMPTGAFYGAQKASQSRHAVYDYARHAIYLVNDKLQDKDSCTLHVRVFDPASNLKYEKKLMVNLKSNRSEEVLKLPVFSWLKTICFLDIRLTDSSGKEIDNNFYWLAGKRDILDYHLKPHGWYFYTLTSQYADFTALNSILKVSVNYRILNRQKEGGYTVFTVELKNKSRYIAFFEQLSIADKTTGNIILPVLWSDNDVSLLPGETRRLTAKIHNECLKNKIPVLKVKGYNE
jgi:exo-1,4-beta-D-glucosaminidase